MRAFLAIPIPGEIQAPLAAEAASFPNLRPVRAEQMHLTLRFLGDVPHRTLHSVMDAIGSVAAAQAAFDIELTRLGCFPSPKKALVVWVGLGEGDLQACALAQSVESALVPLGFERESRPWRGHVTLGRFGKPTRVAARSLKPEAYFGKFRAEEVVLFTSELRPDGPIHTLMHRMPLREDDPLTQPEQTEQNPVPPR